MKMGAASPSGASPRAEMERRSFCWMPAILPAWDSGSPAVLLADRQTCMRQLLKLFLALCPPCCRVVGEAARGGQLLRLVEETKPDVVIFDPVFPDLSFEQIICGITQACPGSRLLAFGCFVDRRLAEECEALGVHGVVDRESPLEVLCAALQSVCDGRFYYDRRLAREGREKTPRSELTSREKDVLRLIAEGWATKEIADIIGGTVKSVARARERVMTKLDLHDAVKLTHYALRRGLVTLR